MSIHTILSEHMANEYKNWRAYWQAQGQPWRTEPEIKLLRQQELVACQDIVPDIAEGRYPFRNCTLSRADIEWLLATQLAPQPLPTTMLDMRGANLSKVDLRSLPLQSLYGGLSEQEWRIATPEQRETAAIHLERADMRGTHLEGAILRGAHLEGADLREAHLEGTDLREAHLEGKGHSLKPLPAADLRMAFFDRTTCLDNIILGDKEHGIVKIADIHWGNVSLTSIAWNNVDMLGDESDARQWKDLDSYQSAIRADSQLAQKLYSQGLYENAEHFAYRAYVNRRVMLRRQLILPLVLRLLQYPQMPAPLVFRRAEQWWHSQRSSGSVLPAILFRMSLLFLLLVGLAFWQPVALAVLLCSCIVLLALFYLLLRRRARLSSTYQPVQAFVLPQHLPTASQRQRYKWLLLLHFLLGKPFASVTQPRTDTWKFPMLLLFLAVLDNTLVYAVKYLCSLLIDISTGYGYKWGRTLCWYGGLLFGFGILYAVIGHMSPLASLLFSIASFHGRGFFVNGNIAWSNPVTILGIGESFIGLIIEVCVLFAVIGYRLRKV